MEDMENKNVSSGAEKAENLANDNQTSNEKYHVETDVAGREKMRYEQKKNHMLSQERVHKEHERLLEKQERNELDAQKQRNKELLLQIEREERLRRDAERRNRRKNGTRTPGFAGWLTAVVCLSFITLALGTTVVAGWFNLNRVQQGMADGYTQSVYELNAVMDNLDVTLAKAKIASSKNEQVRLLTDLAVQSETAETLIERFPVESQSVQSLSSFINKVGDSAKNMLFSVADGKPLTDSQRASISYMYEVANEYSDALHSLVSHADRKSVLNFVKSGGDFFKDDFTTIDNVSVQTPKSIQDGPFSENIEKTNAKNLRSLKDITAPMAETIVKDKFAKYDLTDVKCTGEAVAKELVCYNVTANSKVGQIFVQVSKQGGKIVLLDSFNDCNEKTFTADRCVDIATEFLSSLGYENLVPVWQSEDGTTCTVNFVYKQNGTLVYPDMIKVKVCESVGKVTGLEAFPYVLNHEARTLATPTVSKNMARSRLCENFEVISENLAVIPFDKKERLTYEFYGVCDGDEYFVYVDAKTGEELQSFTVVQTKQGKSLL